MPFTVIGINETPDVSPAVFEARLGRLVDLGYEAVEVRLHHVGASAGAEPVLVGGRLNRRRVRELAASLDRFPLRRTLHASQIFPSEPAYRAYGEEIAWAMVELAEALAAEVVVIHPGAAATGDTPAQAAEDRARQHRIAGEMARRTAAFGARLALENMIAATTYASDPAKLAAEVEALLGEGRDNAGICLDVGHLALSSTSRGFDFGDALRRLAPLTVHTHMSDNCARPGPVAGLSPLEQMRFGVGDLHLPLGWGMIPLEAALAGADFARDPIFLYELNQALRGSLAAGAEEEMVSTARHLVELNRTGSGVALATG